MPDRGPSSTNYYVGQHKNSRPPRVRFRLKDLSRGDPVSVWGRRRSAQTPCRQWLDGASDPPLRGVQAGPRAGRGIGGPRVTPMHLGMP